MKSLMLLSTLILVMTFALDARAPQSRERPTGSKTHRDQAATALPRGNVAHGRYLAEHVAMCIECHSGRDAQGNILEDELFFGGPIPFATPWPNDWATRAPRNRGLPGYWGEYGQRLLIMGVLRLWC